MPNLVKKTYSALRENGIHKTWNNIINRREFAERAIVLRSYPAEVQIEVTNQCLLRCIHCPRSYTDINNIDMKQGMLSVEKFSEILDKLHPVRKIILQGLGESLLNPGIFRMIEEAHKRRFFVSFSTSAAYYDKKIREGLRRFPPDMLALSVDSVEKSSFERVRVNCNFGNFVENLENIIKAVRESDKNIPMFLHCCVMKINSPYLSEIIEFAERMKIRQVSFCALNFSYLENIKNELALGPDDYMNIERALSFARKKNILANFFYESKKQGKILCDYLWKRPYITWDGWVTVCCGRPFTSVHNIGNIFKIDSFKEIWNSSQMQMFRRAIRKGETPDLCLACPFTYEKNA